MILTYVVVPTYSSGELTIINLTPTKTVPIDSGELFPTQEVSNWLLPLGFWLFRNCKKFKFLNRVGAPYYFSISSNLMFFVTAKTCSCFVCGQLRDYKTIDFVSSIG